MRVGIIYAYMDNRRKGQKYGGPIQPMTGALIAALLPTNVEIEVINDNSPGDIDWSRDYDLLFLSSIHSDFDRARQISHYFRSRGAKTVYGGFMASTYPGLCQPFFDAIVIGDAEGTVPQIFQDFCQGGLQPLYVSGPYDAMRVPVPRFDLLADKNLVPLTLEITRGCPFSCEFCALTGIGTRFHTRPPELVVHEIRAGQRMLQGLVPWYKQRIACFVDNNIGGNLRYLDQLCAALTPLDLRWGSQATFNVMADEERVRRLARAGCRVIFMGLESFNPETLADMRKPQNVIDQTKRVMDLSRKHGILITSGLMLSPLVDDMEYLYSLPDRLRECGLHRPSYICFESPIPGTPHFHRLAAQEDAAFLPNALLRDFASYTLVTKPKRESVEDFVAGYRWLNQNTYTVRAKLGRLTQCIPEYIANKWWFSALIDTFKTIGEGEHLQPDRTLLAGSDLQPPEATNVPFRDQDFASAEERRAILEPWRVTDSEGYVLPMWRQSTPIFKAKGAMAVDIQALSSIVAQDRDLTLLTRA